MHTTTFGITDTSLSRARAGTRRPRVIDERRTAAVAMSPYTASHVWEGLVSKVANESARLNLERKSATHIKLENVLVKKKKTQDISSAEGASTMAS